MRPGARSNMSALRWPEVPGRLRRLAARQLGPWASGCMLSIHCHRECLAHAEVTARLHGHAEALAAIVAGASWAEFGDAAGADFLRWCIAQRVMYENSLPWGVTPDEYVHAIRAATVTAEWER
jgi:hypothetical protein